MSAVIRDFVVHQLIINQQQELALIPKSSCFEVTPEIEDLAEQINHAFNTKPGKGVGNFIDTESTESVELNQQQVDSQELAKFSSLLQQMQNDEMEFVEFSIKSSDLLKKSLIETSTVETGFVIFSHYQFLATDYLMIALINTKQHVEINGELELNCSDHLDLAKMQLAVRIDLTQLQITPEQNRYISFIKGRMGRKVSDFFMRFIGCEELVDVKQQNKQLLVSVDHFLASEQLDPAEKQQRREVVSDYYKEQLEQGEDISIRELADKLPTENVTDFYQFNQQSEQPVEENFQADRTILKTLAKFSGQGGGLSLSFDRKLYGDRIQYDAHTDTLVIKGIPPNLKDQLLKS
jgi:nucleoid-associated protein